MAKVTVNIELDAELAACMERICADLACRLCPSRNLASAFETERRSW